jgi:solute carrier family 25 carnitine/acylcarnitine transporter 20/29
VKQTLAAEGPKGLYKGMGAPLATVAVFNAVLFTARGQMEALLRDAPGAHLTVGQQMIAGTPNLLIPSLSHYFFLVA